MNRFDIIFELSWIWFLLLICIGLYSIERDFGELAGLGAGLLTMILAYELVR